MPSSCPERSQGLILFTHHLFPTCGASWHINRRKTRAEGRNKLTGGTRGLPSTALERHRPAAQPSSALSSPALAAAGLLPVFCLSKLQPRSPATCPLPTPPGCPVGTLTPWCPAWRRHNHRIPPPTSRAQRLWGLPRAWLLGSFSIRPSPPHCSLWALPASALELASSSPQTVGASP